MIMHKKKPEIFNAGTLFVLTAIAIYILIYLVSYQVPMHSDDYAYYLKGMTLSKHISHYLNWSGRFIADYTSSILMNLFSRPVYMAINSLAFLAVSIMVTFLPKVVRKTKLIDKGTFIVLWLIFIMYWSGNPNIGETSFWLVGSANYLWPLVWAGAYLLYILYFLSREKRMSAAQLIILIILGIGSGLSNEALGFCMAFFSLCMFAVYRKGDRRTLCTGLLATSIGYAVLLFAPGNFNRLTNDAYTEWHYMSWMERIYEHVFDRMTKAFRGFFLLYIVMIFMLITILLIQKKKEEYTLSVVFALGFAALSVCALAVFAVSPTMPRRSENSALFFTLLSLSFIADILMNSNRKYSSIALGCAALLGMVYFVPSYSFIFHAYRQIMVQSEIREDIILDAKEEGLDTAVIPDWYFTRLLKNTDKLDTFRTTIMFEYYGMTEIEWQDIDYNYAVIRTVDPINTDQELKDGLTLKNVYAKFSAPFENTLVFEFDDNVADYTEEGEKQLYVHLYLDGREGFVNKSLLPGNFLKIGDKYYYGITDPAMDMNKLIKIGIGLYNSETHSRSAAIMIEMPR